jgi:hypothetical protein
MAVRRVSTSPRLGTPLGLRLRGSSLAVVVVVTEPGRTRMAVEVHGPESVLSAVTGKMHGDIWTLTWPHSGGAGDGCTAVFWVPEGTELDVSGARILR